MSDRKLLAWLRGCVAFLVQPSYELFKELTENTRTLWNFIQQAISILLDDIDGHANDATSEKCLRKLPQTEGKSASKRSNVTVANKVGFMARSR